MRSSRGILTDASKTNNDQTISTTTSSPKEPSFTSPRSPKISDTSRHNNKNGSDGDGGGVESPNQSQENAQADESDEVFLSPAKRFESKFILHLSFCLSF